MTVPAQPALMDSGRTQQVIVSHALKLKDAPNASRTKETTLIAQDVPRTFQLLLSTSTRTSNSMSADTTEELLPTVSFQMTLKNPPACSAKKDSSLLELNAFLSFPTV